MNAARHLLPVSELATLLAGRIQFLAPELLPGGKRDGHEWRVGSLQGEPGSSLGVHLTGAKAGVWMDFSTGECGDALNLVAAVRCGGDMREAIRWARQYLGLDSPDPAVLQRAHVQAAKVQEAREQSAVEEQEATRRAALRMWLAGSETIAGTPVETYLRGRGIDLAELGRAPRALRFHAGLFHKDSQRNWPAMVAAIGDMAGQHIGTHRTWLEVQSDGSVRKAPVDKPKMVLGAIRGGCIRLWRAPGAKRLADVPDGETVDITEGIEDGLSVAACTPEARVLAAISLSNVASLELPPAVRAVRIWRQRDDSNAALRAMGKAIDTHVAAGRRVLLPDIPAPFKDVNDMLRGAK